MASKSAAVGFDKGIANDSFKKDKKSESGNWKWMIVFAYGTANVRNFMKLLMLSIKANWGHILSTYECLYCSFLSVALLKPVL